MLKSQALSVFRSIVQISFKRSYFSLPYVVPHIQKHTKTSNIGAIYTSTRIKNLSDVLHSWYVACDNLSDTYLVIIRNYQLHRTWSYCFT